MNLKRLKTALIDLVYVLLTLGVTFCIIILNSVFIANIVNSLRMTGYLDAIFGVQVIMVVVTLFWVPVAILVKYRYH